MEEITKYWLIVTNMKTSTQVDIGEYSKAMRDKRAREVCRDARRRGIEKDIVLRYKEEKIVLP